MTQQLHASCKPAHVKTAADLAFARHIITALKVYDLLQGPQLQFSCYCCRWR